MATRATSVTITIIIAITVFTSADTEAIFIIAFASIAIGAVPMARWLLLAVSGKVVTCTAVEAVISTCAIVIRSIVHRTGIGPCLTCFTILVFLGRGTHAVALIARIATAHAPALLLPRGHVGSCLCRACAWPLPASVVQVVAVLVGAIDAVIIPAGIGVMLVILVWLVLVLILLVVVRARR